MKIEKDGFYRFIDIAKKRPRLYVFILIFLPLSSVGLYFAFPGHYMQEFKINLNSKMSSLIDEEPVEALLTALGDERIFTNKEIEYFNEKAHLKESGPNSFEVTIEGFSRSQIRGMTLRASSAMNERLGKLNNVEYGLEKNNLENMIEKEIKEKIEIEEYLKSVDESEFKGQKDELTSKIDVLASELSMKKQQLQIIDGKLASMEDHNAPNAKIFKEKSGALNAEIQKIEKNKIDLEEQYSQINTFSAGVQEKLARIVFLEKSIEKNGKKLSVLKTLDTGGDSEYIAVPYLYQARIMVPPGKIKGLYDKAIVKKRVNVGLLGAALIILLIFLYYLIFNPIISNTKELEKYSNLPVIGAISDFKS